MSSPPESRSRDEVQAAIFNWTVACFTRSNAVVIGKADKVHGIGSGQRSRIDSAEDAIRLSRRGYGPEGCVLASDAFMPFPDVVELAARHGITAIIYPLGSIRDQEVIARADELGLAMIVTREPGRGRLRALLPAPITRRQSGPSTMGSKNTGRSGISPKDAREPVRTEPETEENRAEA